MITWAKPEFDAAKAAGELVCNMDRAPVLVVGDVTIGQSKAIDRYVAKSVGMMGSTDLEAAQIDMIGEHVRDIKDAYQKAKGSHKDEALAAAQTEFVTVTLPTWLEKLEKTLGGNGFAVGSSISLADVYIYGLTQEYFDHKDQVKEIASKFAKISASVTAVATAGAAYFAARPETKI